MNVIGRKAIIEQRHLAVLQVLPQTLPVSIAVAGKLQQKGAIVTAMCDVKNSAGSPEPIRARHGRRIKDIEAWLTAEKRCPEMDLRTVFEANFYASVSFSGAYLGDTRRQKNSPPQCEISGLEDRRETGRSRKVNGSNRIRL
jgi:hypothetical protein